MTKVTRWFETDVEVLGRETVRLCCEEMVEEVGHPQFSGIYHLECRPKGGWAFRLPKGTIIRVSNTMLIATLKHCGEGLFRSEGAYTLNMPADAPSELFGLQVVWTDRVPSMLTGVPNVSALYEASCQVCKHMPHESWCPHRD